MIALAVAALALPASADATLSLIPAGLGVPLHLHLTHTAQTSAGPQTSSVAFAIVRRSATTLVIERANPDGTPNVSVLKANLDGTLALAEDARGTAADADLADVLFGVNLAIAATRGGDAMGRTPWTATIPIAATADAISAPVDLQPIATGTSEVDFTGDGQTPELATPKRGSASVGADEGGPGGFPGGGGSGFPGGGYPGGGGAGSGYPGGGGRRAPFPDSGSSPGPNAVALRRSGPGLPANVHVQGQVIAGRVTRVAVTITRSVTLGGMPFTNVGNWTLSTSVR